MMYCGYQVLLAPVHVPEQVKPMPWALSRSHTVQYIDSTLASLGDTSTNKQATGLTCNCGSSTTDTWESGICSGEQWRGYGYSDLLHLDQAIADVPEEFCTLEAALSPGDGPSQRHSLHNSRPTVSCWVGYCRVAGHFLTQLLPTIRQTQHMNLDIGLDDVLQRWSEEHRLVVWMSYYQ